MSMPGVQIPHCAAPWCRKDFCSALSIPPSPFARPSTVVTALPSRRAAGTMQAHTARPFSRTVQAPQSPASQPDLVPVRPNCSRRTRVIRAPGSAVTVTGFSFSTKFRGVAMDQQFVRFSTAGCGSRYLKYIPAARDGPFPPWHSCGMPLTPAHHQWASTVPGVRRLPIHPGPPWHTAP